MIDISAAEAKRLDLNQDQRLDSRDVDLLEQDHSLLETVPDIFEADTPREQIDSFKLFLDDHFGAVTLSDSSAPTSDAPFLLNGHGGIYVDGSNNYFGADGAPLQFDAVTGIVGRDGVYYHPASHAIIHAPDGGAPSFLNTYLQDDSGVWRTPFFGYFGGDRLPFEKPAWIPNEQVPVDYLVGFQPLTEDAFATGQISTDGRGTYFGADGTPLAQNGTEHFEADGWGYVINREGDQDFASIITPDGTAYLRSKNQWVHRELVPGGFVPYLSEKPMPTELQRQMPGWIPVSGACDVAVITAGQPIHQIADSLAADFRKDDPVGYWNQRGTLYQEMRGCIGIPNTFSSMEQLDYWTNDRLTNGNYVAGNERISSGAVVATDLAGNPTEFADPNDARIKWNQHGELVAETTDLSGANLSGLDLSRGDWTDYTFSNCNFSGANLSGLDFTDVTIEGSCNFSYANMEQCNLAGADLSGSTFAFAHLKESSLLGCTLNGTSFASANLDGAMFAMCKMSGSNFANSLVRHSTFGACVLDGSNFNNASLINTTCELCSFDACSFNYSSIVSSNLRACAFGTSNFNDSFFIGKSDGSGSDLTQISCHISSEAVRKFYDNHGLSSISGQANREPMVFAGFADLYPIDEPLGIYPQLENAAFGTSQDQAADRIDFIPHERKTSPVEIIGNIFVGAVGTLAGNLMAGPWLGAILGSAASTFVSTQGSWDWEMFGKQAGVGMAAGYLAPVASSYTGLNQTFCSVLISTSLNCAVEGDWDNFLDSFLISLAAAYAADGIDGSIDGTIENKIAGKFASAATRATLEEIVNGDGFTLEALLEFVVDVAFAAIEEHQKEEAIAALEEAMLDQLSEQDQQLLDALGYSAEAMVDFAEQGVTIDNMLAYARNGFPSAVVADLLAAGASPEQIATYRFAESGSSIGTYTPMDVEVEDAEFDKTITATNYTANLNATDLLHAGAEAGLQLATQDPRWEWATFVIQNPDGSYGMSPPVSNMNCCSVVFDPPEGVKVVGWVHSHTDQGPGSERMSENCPENAPPGCMADVDMAAWAKDEYGINKAFLVNAQTHVDGLVTVHVAGTTGFRIAP